MTVNLLSLIVAHIRKLGISVRWAVGCAEQANCVVIAVLGLSKGFWDVILGVTALVNFDAAVDANWAG